jgi:hypothetical protein
MSTMNDGGSAFPIPHTIVDANDLCFKLGQSGMTLRDYFAAKAMQAYITAYVNTGKQEPDHSYIPVWSYETADEMLKAREGV